MVKTISTITATMVCIVTLGASWTHFYTEQKINTSKIHSLQTDKRELAGVVYDLNINQTRLIETVSNNTKSNLELKKDFKEVIKILNKNQEVIAKMVERATKRN